MIKETLDRITAAETEARSNVDNAVKKKAETVSFAKLRAQEMVAEAEEDSKAKVRMAEVSLSEDEDKKISQARAEGRNEAEELRKTAAAREDKAIKAILEFITK